MAYLVLVRHGESEWNAKGLWTGWTDIGLSEKGRKEALRAGEALKDIHFDVFYVSALKRAQQTLEGIKTATGQTDVPTHIDKALNERNYGIYTKKNKWEIERELGEEEFMKLRRGWDVPIPDGESLRQVYDRVVPYYKSHILPDIESGKNVLVSAHGNSLRALVKFLENVPNDKISELNIPTGEVYVYTVDENGNITNKEVRASHAEKQ